MDAQVSHHQGKRPAPLFCDPLFLHSGHRPCSTLLTVRDETAKTPGETSARSRRGVLETVRQGQEGRARPLGCGKRQPSLLQRRIGGCSRSVHE